MSSYYGVVFPEFWTGETGRAIQQHGGKDAQLTALYLMSCRYATMIGLYPLPVRDIRHETGVGMKGLVRAFNVLSLVSFANYDARTEHVWVREMAKFRLGLQVKALESKDNRVIGIQRLYDRLTENPFLEPFFDRYAKEIHLRGKRRSGRSAEPLLDVAPSKGLGSPLQASDQDQDQSTEIRYRDQVQGSGTEKAPPLSRRSVENLSKNSNARTQDGEPDLSAALRDSQGATRSGADDRRRGVEGADPRAVGPIGFRAAAPRDDEPSDVSGGARVPEVPRSASDSADGATATAETGTASPQQSGSGADLQPDSPGLRAITEAKARILALPRMEPRRPKRERDSESK